MASVGPVVIERSRGWSAIKVAEIWRYRELLAFLVWRDLKVRYKQTVFGALWAVLQPLLLMAVFALFLGKLAHVPSNGEPYAVFVYAALVVWTLAAGVVNASANSVVNSGDLISKVYFPRIIVPVAAGLSYVLDLVIAALLLLPLAAIYGVTLRWTVFWLPAFALLGFAIALALGVFLSALNVRYRDVRHALPFLIQLWLFLSPVVYPARLVPSRWRLLYSANPMAAAVEGFRWALFGHGGLGAPSIALGVAMTVAMGALGVWYFQRTQPSFADIV